MKKILFIILVIILGFAIYFFTRHEPYDDHYIEVYTDAITDIGLYSVGSGYNERIYLGSQPIHYIVDSNGQVRTYQRGLYKNAKTGIEDPSKTIYYDQLCKKQLRALKDELDYLMLSDECKVECTHIKVGKKSKSVSYLNMYRILKKYIPDLKEE